MAQMTYTPHSLSHPNDEYLMRLNPKTGLYETDLPKERVGKIGVTYPKKKQFTLVELLSKGWKHE